ncbi:alkaline phosphatase [Reinekea marinisedimentorum]|uniref:Alkaline phosphatase n=1 Tax=Reinekea marinisedimentorum TaxID=230495 RepID=A0A4R3I6G6_9GAMM|nr:alkaline phosphatase [Reinekea marinisedimentorum]TCS40403.1 alkaline phosphatase [Reinekea marinisedimentorum]
MLKLNKVLLASSIALSAIAQADAPKYVFYMIGDGLSSAQRQVAEYYAQGQQNNPDYHLAINTLPVTGIITTQSSNSLVTDSAAAGTALATGMKTDNGVISLTPDGKELSTLLEGAEKQGKATGLITTTRLTHATPAVFATKNSNRNAENEIAVDYLDSGVDFLAGGGYRNFINGEGSKRTDDRNLVDEFANNGYQTFIGADATGSFLSHKAKNGEQVLALFSQSHLPYAIDRIEGETPSLAQMTEKGIELLAKDKDGFFLMVEGGRIDHAAHANDVAGVIGDTIAFDNAVKAAIEFYHQHPKDTLIVVVGDHETGGMGLGLGKQYFMNLDRVANFKESIEDKLQKVYQGDRAAFFAHIAETYALNDLSAEEKASIEQAMDFADAGQKDEAHIWGGYDPVAMSVAHITSKRAGVYWTSYAHTATQLPVSAMGVGAESFGGFADNTEVAMKMAKAMDVKIGL